MAPSTRPPVDVDALRKLGQVAALSGVIAGNNVDEITEAIRPAHVRGRFTPDVAILELAVDALTLASPDPSDPLPFEGLRERYLPEARFHGKNDLRSIQYALYAPAIMRGGLRPDLLNDAGWWDPPLWTYATYALVIYLRAAADRQHTTASTIAQHIANDRGLTLEPARAAAR